MAPEIYANKGYDYVVDWYAIGIVIYQMLIGSPLDESIGLCSRWNLEPKFGENSQLLFR
jgi:serine/threonine protein kinase